MNTQLAHYHWKKQIRRGYGVFKVRITSAAVGCNIWFWYRKISIYNCIGTIGDDEQLPGEIQLAYACPQSRFLHILAFYNIINRRFVFFISIF